MAFQMNYTDSKTGAQYPQSYWLPTNVSFNKQTKQGSISFFGFVDAQARLDNKQRLAAITYRITPSIYDVYFAVDAQNPEGKNPYSAAYELASATLEGEEPTEGEPDTRVSFFYTAVHV